MNPWDRQPFDTDETWPWFVAYRDRTAGTRSLSRVTLPGKVTPVLQTKMDWANAGHWHDRALAWDQHCDELKQLEREEFLKHGARAAAEREQELANRAMDLALREIDKIDRTSQESDVELDAGNVARTMATAERAVKVSRLVRGESTEKVDTGEDVNYDNLSVEELLKLRELRAKARSSQQS